MRKLRRSPRRNDIGPGLSGAAHAQKAGQLKIKTLAAKRVLRGECIFADTRPVRRHVSDVALASAGERHFCCHHHHVHDVRIKR